MRWSVVAVVLLAPAVVHAEQEPVFPVDVAVTQDEKGAVVDRAWIDAELALAERVFGPLGIHFGIDHTRDLGTELARIEDPRNRDRFAPLVTAHQVQVFIVRSLRDNEQVGVYRKGVTWDSRTTPSRRYIILSADASPSSLAHEFGHYFGLLAHSPVKNNLMSYDRDDALVFLDAGQQSVVKATARVQRTSHALDVLRWIQGGSVT